MAVSWSFTMLLVVTIVALFTFSQPLFQLALPEAVEEYTQTDLEIALQAAVPRVHNPLTVSEASADAESSSTAAWSLDMLRRGSRRPQRYYWARKLIQRRPAPCVDDLLLLLQQQQQQQQRQISDHELPGEEESTTSPRISRRSVLATFQSDRMVPTGPNPLHNSNRSQVIFP